MENNCDQAELAAFDYEISDASLEIAAAHRALVGFLSRTLAHRYETDTGLPGYGHTIRGVLLRDPVPYPSPCRIRRISLG